MANLPTIIIGETCTIGQFYGPAMEITDPSEAAAYFQQMTDYMMASYNMSREQAESVERQNLGYYAGYYDNETRARVERLFGGIHPIFGNMNVTPEQAFKAGQDRANKA